MNRRLTNPFPALVESFFCGYLQHIRAASPHTVRAYRDTLKLFFIFLAQERSVAELRIEDLQVDHVVRFLRNLEEVRKNGRATRNCRLTALRSFFGHLLRHDPTHAEQYNRVLAIPSREARSVLCQLSRTRGSTCNTRPAQSLHGAGCTGPRAPALPLQHWRTGSAKLCQLE